MSKNDDKKDNNKLTPKQELFAQEIAKGKSQRQAYYEAYPKSKKWKVETVDAQASRLANNNKVLIRLDELKKIAEKKIEWTRNRALNEINYVLEMNKADMERINEAYQIEIDLHEAKLMELANLMIVPNIDTRKVALEMQHHTSEIARLKKIRRTSSVNTNGILSAARVLNRMYGFDITKVEINDSDTERKEVEKLDNDKLEVLANAILNSRKSDSGTAE